MPNDVWHDRAVFQFLTSPADQQAYVRAVLQALKPGCTLLLVSADMPVTWVRHSDNSTFMIDRKRADLSKVPEVTLVFWIIKVLATTLGETGGDAFSMSLNLGYIASTGIFVVIFAIFVAIQANAKGFNPYIYWGTILATTTLGTTLADLVDRSLHIGYAGGTSLLIALLLGSLLIWKRDLGTISVESVSTPKAEFYYWTTILFSQTLGTALGDWTADSAGLGYLGSAVVFGSLLLAVYFAHRSKAIDGSIIFWSAFVLTRPLGAVVGDFLDKPLAKGGLALSRYSASMALLAMIITLLILTKQRPARIAH
jgi:uncharacterized membrane-anchored protein